MSTLSDTISGFQHLGLPVRDIEESIAFYRRLGFSVFRRHEFDENGATTQVAFLDMKAFRLELYQPAAGVANDRSTGTIDHIALDVQDIDTAHKAVQEAGFEIVEGINELPLHAKGIRYFMILGPDNERVEFNQIL
ncbi:VOC family protein [Marispirochaeta aestuarii]|uniref:VOC family protein n=1 Tax=Marispirochaeta aestuarii TaxID=1963862 RepID=UPI0029C83472|nr:VOC family protein [Marispirochaeta aestuarii]